MSIAPGKSLLFLVFGLSAGRASASLEADVHTSRGTVTVILEYEAAPKAVANFMTLANGGRQWVDSRTGAVKSGPFYDGLVFHDIENTDDSKLAGAGSRDGSGSDDAGYRFQDELSSALVHEPYVIALSNDGPNTNGSRFYFTGGTGMPRRDGRHGVFGKIPPQGGREVVDAIISAGAGETSILSVSFRRTSPAAESFDELAVSLPVVEAVSGALQVIPGSAVRLDFPRAAHSILQAHASPDLFLWEPHFRSFTGLDDAIPAAPEIIDGAEFPSRFYHLSLVRFPSATGPSGFSGRTLSIHTPATGAIVYEFDATGLAGTYRNTPVPGLPLNFTGPFRVRHEIPSKYDAYGFSILVEAEGLGGAPLNWIRGGFDDVRETSIDGRQITRFYDDSMNLVFEDEGSVVLGRP